MKLILARLVLFTHALYSELVRAAYLHGNLRSTIHTKKKSDVSRFFSGSCAQVVHCRNDITQGFFSPITKAPSAGSRK